MGFDLHRTPDPPKLIRVGYGRNIPDAPITESARQRRPKVAEKKLKDETGTKTIRKDDADQKGAIGSRGDMAPAQQKVPSEDVKIGNKEKDNA